MNAKQSLSSISSNQDLWVEQPSFRSSLIYLFSQQSNLRIKPIRRKAPLFVYTKTGSLCTRHQKYTISIKIFVSSAAQRKYLQEQM